MAEQARRPAGPRRATQVIRSPDFKRWSSSLDAEGRARVAGMVAYIAVAGPTLGRPRVDVVHGTRMHKLKEARVGRGIRLLFAFDSNQNLVMLVGGDKTGNWNRWYPKNIDRAEELYGAHERSIGKEPRWLAQRATPRRPPETSR